VEVRDDESAYGHRVDAQRIQVGACGWELIARLAVNEAIDHHPCIVQQVKDDAFSDAPAEKRNFDFIP
jgi:hypothetical protein